MTTEKITFDNKDDRKQIISALEKLSPEGRIGFLKWCCSRASTPALRHTVGPGTLGLVNEIMLDVTMLIMQHGLSERDVLSELERRARIYS